MAPPSPFCSTMQNTDTHSKVHKIESNTKRKIYLTKKKQKIHAIDYPVSELSKKKYRESKKPLPK